MLNFRGQFDMTEKVDTHRVKFSVCFKNRTASCFSCPWKWTSELYFFFRQRFLTSSLFPLHTECTSMAYPLTEALSGKGIIIIDLFLLFLRSSLYFSHIFCKYWIVLVSSLSTTLSNHLFSLLNIVFSQTRLWQVSLGHQYFFCCKVTLL